MSSPVNVGPGAPTGEGNIRRPDPPQDPEAPLSPKDDAQVGPGAPTGEIKRPATAGG